MDDRFREVAAGEGIEKIKGRKGLLFCEQKRSKKNFDSFGLCRFNARAPNRKSFLLLFSKKKSCLVLIDIAKPVTRDAGSHNTL
jgi:hypothetical protein